MVFCIAILKQSWVKMNRESRNKNSQSSTHVGKHHKHIKHTLQKIHKNYWRISQEKHKNKQCLIKTVHVNDTELYWLQQQFLSDRVDFHQG